jgi:hypothetical protein
MALLTVELLGRAEWSEDLGSIDMKPMGKAAFMSCWCNINEVGVCGLVVWDLRTKHSCWAVEWRN